MATRLTLLCHGATRSMRDGGFPAVEEAVDEGGLAKAAGLGQSGTVGFAMASPALAARQTADALGVEASAEHSLRDIDHGDWTGQGFDAVHQRDPAGLAAWIADPARGTPGGETLAEAIARVAPWLAEQAGRDAQILAITHPMIVRALLAVALDIPPAATLRFDIAPLSRATLSFNRIWRLQALGGD